MSLDEFDWSVFKNIDCTEMGENMDALVKIINTEKVIMEQLYYKNDSKSYEEKLDVIDTTLTYLEMFQMFIKEKNMKAFFLMMDDSNYRKYIQYKTLEGCFFATKKINNKTVINQKKTDIKKALRVFLSSFHDLIIKSGVIDNEIKN